MSLVPFLAGAAAIGGIGYLATRHKTVHVGPPPHPGTVDISKYTDDSSDGPVGPDAISDDGAGNVTNQPTDSRGGIVSGNLSTSVANPFAQDAPTGGPQPGQVIVDPVRTSPNPKVRALLERSPKITKADTSRMYSDLNATGGVSL